MSETVCYFQEESWENVFSINAVNSTFNKFLSTFLNNLEASFPYIYLSNNRDKGWITQGVRKSSQRKRRLYIISNNSDNLMIKLHYKKYCSILKGLIREAKNVYFKQLIETSENKTKTVWNIIN